MTWVEQASKKNWPDSREFWRDKRVIVAGGAGFLGSYVVDRLRERGAAEIIVPRSQDYDLRDIRVSFAKIRRVLGYEPQISVEEGIIEVRDAITSGLIKEPLASRHRNAQFIVQ